MVSDNYWVKQLWEMGILGALWYTAVLALAALAALRLFRAALQADAALSARLEDAAAAVAQPQADEEHAQHRVEALLASAGVADDEEFRRAGAAFVAASGSGSSFPSAT